MLQSSTVKVATRPTCLSPHGMTYIDTGRASGMSRLWRDGVAGGA